VAPGAGEAGTVAATAAPAAPAPVAATAPEAPKPATPAKPKPPIAVTPPPEPSFIDSLLDNPLVLALIAILVAALGALGIRRAGLGRKKEQEFEDSGTLTDSSGLKANSLFASTGGQSVDTSNSVFNSNFSPSASQLDTNEVDPVAEADVYIAYGRDAQAEEILKEALRTQPDRNAVRVKLLEIYASRNDLRAFETTASELYGRTKGEGEEWQQAASLGIGIDPKNPMYAGGKVADAPEQDKPALGAPSNSADELDLDGLLNTTQAVPDAPEQKAPDFPAYGKSDAEDVPVLPVSAPPTPAESAAPPAKDTPAQDTADNTLDFDFDLNRLGHADAPAPQTEWKPADAKSEPVPDLDFDPNSLDFDVRNYAAPAAKPGDEAHADDTPPHIDFPEVSEPAGAASEAPREPKDPAPLDFDLSNISLDLDIGNHGAAAEAIDDGNTNVAEMATKLDLALAYQEIGDQEGARELLDEVIKGGNTDQSEKARSLLEKLA
jgi:pilus assembly protein FimV